MLSHIRRLGFTLGSTESSCGPAFVAGCGATDRVSAMSVQPSPGSTLPAPHHVPADWSDRLAYAFTKFLRFLADTFFARRYGHRAVILETVAAVPGMEIGRASCRERV